MNKDPVMSDRDEELLKCLHKMDRKIDCIGDRGIRLFLDHQRAKMYRLILTGVSVEGFDEQEAKLIAEFGLDD